MFILHIFSSGDGEAVGYLEEVPGSGELFVGGVGLGLIAEALAVLAAWFVWAMGGVLFLPLACLLLVLLVIDFLAELEALHPVGTPLVIMPFVLYGFACLSFGVFGATDRVGSGAMGIIGWLLFGVGILVLCGFICAKIDGEWAFAVMLIAGGIIWWASLYATNGISYGASEYEVLVWLFRILGIGMLVGVVLCAVSAIQEHLAGWAHGAGFVLAFIAGFAPIVVGKLASGFGPALCVGMTLVSYVIIAVFLPKVGGQRLAPSSLTVTFIVLAICYLLTHADLSLLPPIARPNAIALALTANPVIQLGGEAMGSIAGSFAALVRAGLLSLDAALGPSGSSFAIPEVAGCLIGFGAVVLTLSATEAVMNKLSQKR